MAFDDLDEPAQQFLKRLFEQSAGQSSRQVSMYEIGAALGWERDAALQKAQDLMAAGLVEIRTLSGGIGISAEGVESVKSALAPAAPAPSLARLGSGPVMDTAVCRIVERVCDGIKAQTGSLDLDFDSLTELVADLKTIADQLGSPRPKTAVVRECLRSLEGVLKRYAGNRSLVDVRALIGD
jgi:hypothetical protein